MMRRNVEKLLNSFITTAYKNGIILHSRRMHINNFIRTAVVQSSSGTSLQSSSTCGIVSLGDNRRSPSVLIHPMFGHTQCRHAGHSKWSNIRHVKGAKDAKRASLADNIVRRIRIAIRDGGSSDPKLNSQLASLMAEAQNNNIPKATVENAIKNFAKSSSSGKTIYMEMLGPGSCFLVVEAVTDKAQHLRNKVVHILKKYRSTLGDAGFAAHSFDLKGIVNVSLNEGEEFDLDVATETAIEVGAEDVQEVVEDDNRYAQFICDTKELHLVKKNLQESGKEVSVARLAYIPTNFATLDEETLKSVDSLVNALEEMDEVVRVYDNIQLKES